MPKPLPVIVRKPMDHIECLDHDLLHHELTRDVRELKPHQIERTKQITAVLLGKFDIFLEQLSKQEVDRLYVQHRDKDIVIRALRYKIIRSKEIGPLLAELGQIDYNLVTNVMRHLEKILRQRYDL